jgi:hypothetical protein
MAYAAAAGRHGRGMGRRRRSSGLRDTDGVNQLVLAIGVVAGLLIAPLPGWVPVVVLTTLIGAFFFRAFHHTGDRHRRVATPAEEAQFEAEHTPIRGTVLPVGVAPIEEAHELPPALPLPSLVPTRAREPRISAADKAKVASIVLAVVVTVLAKASNHRLDNAQRMQNDLERLLGIPGQWNNYGRGNTP